MAQLREATFQVLPDKSTLGSVHARVLKTGKNITYL
jgi:hypothetical protein